MNPLFLGPLLDIGSKLIDRLIPDPKAAAEAQLKLLELQQKGDLAELQADLETAVGQLEINKAEAASGSIFVAGWRPFIGWTCGTGLALNYVVSPILTWITTLIGHPVPFPTLDWSTMWPIVGGMLGLGGMRSWEKKQGVAR